MSTPVEPRVEFDDRIRRRPELVRAAEEATAFLDKRIGVKPTVPPPSLIRWGVRPLDPSSVELAMADETDGLGAVGVIPVKYMTAADTYARNTLTARVWDDLLSERSRVIGARIDRRLAALRAEIAAEEDASTPLTRNGA